MMDPIIREDIDRVKKSVDLEPFRGKNVLISGGSGFLGSWICDALNQIASRIICVDNLSTGVFENIEHLKGVKGFKFERADVCTYSRNPKVDMIFHLASRPAPEDYQKHPVETALANATGTDKMLDLARRSDARVFYASSSEVYGDAEMFPTPESYEGRVNPLGPRSCYEEGKRFGEALCKAYHDQYGLDVRIGRLFNSYGPRLRPDGLYGRVVSRFLLQAFRGDNVTVFGDGSQTRSFCYVADTIIGLLRLVVKEGVSGEAVNIGNTVETNIIDLANKIIHISTSKSQVEFRPFPTGDHHRRLPDGKKAKMILDWGPNIGLDEGLGRTVGWLQVQSTKIPSS